MLSIIDFERVHHNRTLINQLVSGLMWAGVVWNLVMQPLTFIRYLVGFIDSQIICGLDAILRNSISMFGILLFDWIIIVRYLFLFYLKNPTALQDDFWKLFICLWNVGLCSISQFVYIFSPGKNPMNFYMCVGQYPIEYQNLPVKLNLSLLFISIFSLLIHLVAGIWNMYNDHWKKSQLTNSDNTNNTSLFTHTSNIFGTIAMFLFAFINPVLINQMEPSKLDLYPNYLLLYFLHHYNTQLTLAIVTGAFLYKSCGMRSKVWKDLKNILNFFRKLFNY